MEMQEQEAPGRIRLLSDDLANKIAAGEVVERPASIVKELVENAIDAGATRIDVFLEAGGRDLVEVVDDGDGMGFRDARLCLERHATSKLLDADGLFSIRTLGFRGEALPSIAAVSRLEILTRRREEVSGTSVRVEHGEIVEHIEAAAPAGTTIRVKDLFHNVPARRKFLRRPETEVGHASETLVRLALAHPDIGFRLKSGPRTIFSSPPKAGLSERIAAALGRDVAPHLHPLAGVSDPVRLSGLLAAPQVTRASNRGIFIFVNKRFVRDRSLGHAVTRAYGDLVDRGRSPIVVLFLEMPPDFVDVNVHPQKIEVRFSDGRRVYDAVAQAVGRTLAASPWAGSAGRSYALSTGEQKAQDGSTLDTPQSLAGFTDHKARVLDALQRFGAGRAGGQPFLTKDPPGAELLPIGSASIPLEDRFFAGLQVIGQLKASYILCESEDGLVIVDQHAAHERLAFDRLKDAYRERRVPVQNLLVPRTLSLPTGQAEKLEEHGELLSEAGFDISAMGAGDVAVRAVPSVIADADVGAILSDLLEEISTEGASAGYERRIDETLATIACHSVVRAGSALSRAECEALLAELDSAKVKGSCPHGRPVAFTLSMAELERRFGRR